MAWKEKHITLLREEWMRGTSFTGIAQKLGEGFTRNAVAGKIRDLNLPKGKKVQSNGQTKKPAKTAEPETISLQTLDSSPVSAEDGPFDNAIIDFSSLELLSYEKPTTLRARRGVTLLQLDENTCKWPLGDPLKKGFSFCGHRSMEESPYCEFHTKRARRPVPTVSMGGTKSNAR